MKYQSRKVYGNDRGLSCCFRQWRSSHSHCSTLHGYSIGIELIFETEKLDDRNWCFDFGGLAPFKTWADYMFDHTVVVAQDDPHLEFFREMAGLVSEGPQYKHESEVPHERGALIDLRIVPAVGCEKFAELAFYKMKDILMNLKYDGEYDLYTDSGIGGIWDIGAKQYPPLPEPKKFRTRYPIGQEVELKSVMVFEHSGNSATYYNPNP